MKILHYTLGFPPYRTGGLTKYCCDLMHAELNDKNEVIALWPGKKSIIINKPIIKKKKKNQGIENYELINPLPIPLDEGIMDIDKFIKKCDDTAYIKFLNKVKPDVIHIHTLMGLHKEFIEAASKLKIRTIYTTHDYFGICPKVTLFRNGSVCNNDNNCVNCINCNKTALSIKKIYIMQSPIYRTLKNTKLVKLLRKNHRKKFFEEETIDDLVDKKELYKANDYQRLRDYYKMILESIDFIHFNSSVTEKIYKKYITPKNSKIISITHSDILDNRNIKKVESTTLRLTYLAPAKKFKGYFIVKEALDKLWNSGNHNFILNIYGNINKPSPYMNIKENGYKYSDLKSIFSETDILLAPSVWYETFGFTVLEAISYGTPVIVSENVGAKDIIGNGGIIIKANSSEKLYETIVNINKKNINELRKNINKLNIKKWKDFVEENYSIYRGK